MATKKFKAHKPIVALPEFKAAILGALGHSMKKPYTASYSLDDTVELVRKCHEHRIELEDELRAIEDEDDLDTTTLKKIADALGIVVIADNRKMISSIINEARRLKNVYNGWEEICKHAEKYFPRDSFQTQAQVLRKVETALKHFASNGHAISLQIDAPLPPSVINYQQQLAGALGLEWRGTSFEQWDLIDEARKMYNRATKAEADLKEHRRAMGVAMGIFSMEKIEETDLAAYAGQLLDFKQAVRKVLNNTSHKDNGKILAMVQQMAAEHAQMEKELYELRGERVDDEREPMSLVHEEKVEEHDDLIEGILKQQTKIAERLNEVERKLADLETNSKAAIDVQVQHVQHGSLRGDTLSYKVAELWKRKYVDWASYDSQNYTFDHLVAATTAVAFKELMHMRTAVPTHIAILDAWTRWQKQAKGTPFPEHFIYAFITGWRP